MSTTLEAPKATPDSEGSKTQRQVPAIVFGGNDNALSIVRSLGKRRVPVYVLNDLSSDVHYSRFGRRIRLPDGVPFLQAAKQFLLGEESEFLRKAVLLAANDEALEVLSQHRETLERKFRLDLSNPVAQQQMLDKLTTYQLASEVEVPTPLFWQIQSLEDVEAHRSEFVYPLIVKPKLSHVFQQKFRKKFLVAQDYDELNEALSTVRQENIEVLLVEFIPGPDAQLCSYYTYLDEEGHALFDFTKRIIRRHPTNMGLACYHITDHVPGVGELARRLFQRAGLRGLANAEFKLDKRDGQLKLIECNARFTAANGLVAKAGFDLSNFVYNRILGIDQSPLKDFRDGLRLWDPLRDFRAYRELSRRGELTLFQWIESILHWQMLPAFAWDDPVPGFVRFWKRLRKGGK
ncbi:MAG: hypothetical protein ACFCD0_01655 [Gemmataceae bacterium]